MINHTRSAHVALLTRARTALSASVDRADADMEVVADLDAAIACIEQRPAPWSVAVHLATIGHGTGTSVAVALSHKALRNKVAVFCRTQWAEINDPRDPALLDSQTLVRDYFDRHQEDQLTSRIELIDPDFDDDANGLETGNYLALSSSHISWQTTVKIDKWLTLDPSDRPVSVADTHYGWFICALRSSFGDYLEIPDDLFHALTFARDQGCTYLLLDRDAPATDRLPCFEW
ncbi:hypothetical protein NOLU111490_12275 [Novosphingobium lubricantis]